MTRNPKYDPLRVHLGRLRDDVVEFTFEEIEGIIGDKLAPSAYHFRQWWENSRSHFHARAWLDAGWRVDGVNLERRRVQFIRG